MTATETTALSPIAQLNDRFRQGDYTLGQVFTTQLVQGLSSVDQQELFRLVRVFDNFTPGNDPYGEHNFGSIEYQDDQYFWKIDCYTPDLKHGSEDPSNPAVTTRVMTLMQTSEY